MTTRADQQAFGFAQTKYDDDGTPIGDLSRPGLTKREYFAALAMQGMMAQANEFSTYRGLADSAVRHADALIAALNDEGQTNG